MPRALTRDDLYAIPFASDPQLSPDGSQVAFVVTKADREADENRSTIWVVSAPYGAIHEKPISPSRMAPYAEKGTGEPREVTTGGKDVSPRWSPDGRTLAFVSSRGDSPAQLYLIPTEGGEARKLTDLPLGVGEPVWSPDGNRIAFAAPVDIDGDAESKDEDRKAREPVVVNRLDYKADGLGLLRGMRQHLFVLATDGGEPAQITNGDYFASTPVWSPDGTRLAFSASMGEDRDLHPASVVYVVSAGGGEPRAVTPADGFYTVAWWHPSGDSLLLVGQERLRNGPASLFAVGTSGGERPRPLLPEFDRNVMAGEPAYPGAVPRFGADGTVLFCARERGRVHILSVPPTGGGPPDTVVGGDRVVAGMSERDGRVAFVAATPTSPGEIHVLDANGERQVTHLLATALPDVELIEPEGRTFHAPDGAEIEGWILRARSASGRTPLLVDIHGGPHNAWGPVFDGVHVWQQTLADQGWTILVINPRGSDGYGETFWSSLLADGWGHADEQDFHAAIDALIEEGLADPEQVALTGYSYGGYMSCWLTARSDRFAAAVAGGSVTDLVGEAGTSDLGWYLDMIEFGRDVYDNQAWVADRSPITHVHRARTPTLLLHGEDDLRCPIGQAEQWFAALRSRGVPTQLVRYPGAGHLFILSGRPSHRVDYCRRVEEWVTSHVGARATART